jgi:hypothetical protein
MDSSLARLRRTALMAASVLAVGVVLTACGGAPTPGADSGPTAGHAQATRLLAYASCMRSHGIPNFPDPTAKGGIPKTAVIAAFRAVSNSQAQTAQNDCRHLLPTTGSLSGRANPVLSAKQRQDYLKAASCMRSHGITDFPDPTFRDSHVSLDVPSSIDTHSPQFTQAEEICTKLIPAGLPYSRG